MRARAYEHHDGKFSHANEEAEDSCVELFWRTKPILQEWVDKNGRLCTMLKARCTIPGKDDKIRFAADEEDAVFL